MTTISCTGAAAVALSLRVDGLFEQKRLAVFFLDAAAKLPAHQRMHLLIFVDGFFDANQQTLALESLQMIVQIRIFACWYHRRFTRDREFFFGHCLTPLQISLARSL